MRILDSDERLKKVPDEFKQIAKDFAEKGFITTSTNNLINMKSHNISLISSLILITMSGWGYLSSETPSVTALIPLFFGVIPMAFNRF